MSASVKPMRVLRAGFRLLLHGLSAESLHGFLVECKHGRMPRLAKRVPPALNVQRPAITGTN
ncbi:MULTISPECIES: hypothetical protein [Myxococcus]|uniref:hypothetical protein n=1 Tax=Myxococcus TaxID=32 RepID=UPI001129665E|nr:MULTISPECIES: hypothetical protein [Myxococcus]WAM24246.1 hypothetical protein OZ403_27345 [Myxococcus sp. NMCA1]